MPINCEQIMTANPVCCSASDTAATAARAMHGNGVGLLLLVGAAGRIATRLAEPETAGEVVRAISEPVES